MAIGEEQTEANRMNAEIRGKARAGVIEPREEREPDPLGDAAAALGQALGLLAEAVESEEPYRIAAAELLLDQACRDWLVARAPKEEREAVANVDFAAGAAKSAQPEETMTTKMRRSAGYAP